MRNITITVDEETAHWARMEAARRDVSVSRLLRDLLREQVDGYATYEQAEADFLAQHPQVLRAADQGYPCREEVHDRAGLR
jgi:hypothetical protein